ncbi:MAG: AmmeMemoRadiSam system protein B, partial [Spirochaetota bacterium]
MSENGSTRKVREATHSGIFYPEDPSALASTIAGLFEAVPETEARRALGIVSPHASIEYSGDLSALAWKASAGRKLARIVILAPLHRSQEPAIFLPESSLFESPLGAMEVDERAIAGLMDCGTFYVVNDIPHFEEHGIEVQLPFARTLYPKARIVPILLGRATLPVVKSLATGLRLVFGAEKQSTLFVVSSDLAFARSPSESSRLS